MKKILAILSALLAAIFLSAQPTPVGGAPAATQAEVNAGTVQNKYVSPYTLFHWTGGGGGGAFSAITAGTNAHALVMGTGGSLTTSGTGTIAATSAPFSGITGGTNTTAAMHVGTGASLDATGSGTITASAVAVGGITGLGTTVGATLANAINADSGMVVKNSDSTLTLAGSVISSPATITLTANAGTLAITNRYSAVTVTANSTLTPSAAGANGQTCSVKVTNGQAASVTLLMDNTGADYTRTIPVGFIWITYTSNGTDWVPDVIDPASASVASTSRTLHQNPSTGVYFYDTVAADVAAALNATPATVAQGGTNATTAIGAVNSLTPAPVSLGNLTGTINIDLSTGVSFYGTLTGATTFTFSNPQVGKVYVVQCDQTGTNTYTVAWPTMQWTGGSAPTMTTGAATTDTFTFIYRGTSYYASAQQNQK